MAEGVLEFRAMAAFISYDATSSCDDGQACQVPWVEGKEMNGYFERVISRDVPL